MTNEISTTLPRGGVALRYIRQVAIDPTVRAAAATLVLIAGIGIAAIVATSIGFHNSGVLSRLQLTKDQAAYWELILKAIGGFVALAGALLAVSKYLLETERANHAALIEARKPFMQKRQDIYYQLVSATALIGTKDRDDPVRREAETTFWLIYWGAIPLVADLRVGGAVNRFSEALDTPDDGVKLRNASMDLAQACRASLGYAPPSAGI